MASLDPIDESDKFDIIVSKWKNISPIVMNLRCVEHRQNNLATCKELNGVPFLVYLVTFVTIITRKVPMTLLNSLIHSLKIQLNLQLWFNQVVFDINQSLGQHIHDISLTILTTSISMFFLSCHIQTATTAKETFKYAYIIVVLIMNLKSTSIFFIHKYLL